MGGREWEVFVLVWGICTWVRDGEQHSPCETVGGRDRCVHVCVGVYSRQDKQRGGTQEKARKYAEFQRLLVSGAGARVASGTASTAERHRVAEAPIPRRVVSREHCSRALFPSTAGTSSSARCTRHRPKTIASTRLWAGTWSATWRRSGRRAGPRGRVRRRRRRRTGLRHRARRRRARRRRARRRRARRRRPRRGIHRRPRASARGRAARAARRARGRRGRTAAT